MTEAANQRIHLDAEVLSAQIRTLADASESLAAAEARAGRTLPGDAFGALSAGILVPAVNALSERSRELLGAAHELAARTRDGAAAALDAFSAIEQHAVEEFHRLAEGIS